MKNFILFCGILFTCACNSINDADEANAKTEFDVEAPEVLPTTNMDSKPMYNPETALYIWHTTANYTKVKNPASQIENIKNADSLIWGLNEYYENVFLQKDTLSHDTLYLQVKDNNFLGNQMGSTGAEMWLADVVLNLSEVPGVKYIHIDMDTSNHILPGTWKASDFKKYKESAGK